MQKYKLEIIAFVGGVVVMILELVGSRILAPYVGTSIIVWTSLIGIILASLSLGYWWGGRLADKGGNYKTFSLIILTSGFLIALTAFIKIPILVFLQENITDVRVAAVVATLILFATPSVTLGMISPYAIRLKMETVAKSGATAGGIYAVSTIGSIVGTFLAGFYLISILGSTKILYVLSVVLIITSFFAYEKVDKKWMSLFVLTILVIFAAFFIENLSNPNLLVDADTQYSRVWIFESSDPVTERPMLNLVTDAKGRQSSMFLDKDDDLATEYTKYFRLAKHFNLSAKNTLMIGGGAYSYPKDFLKRNPEGSIDVVELDPVLTDLAKKYFNLKDDPRLTIYHQDGRIFLNQTNTKYDAVLIDAYRSSLAIPYQLTTKEAIEAIYSSLTDEGVVIVNIISSIESEKGKFLRAEYLTYKQVFPQIYLFPVQYPKGNIIPQNIILIALKSKEKPVFESENPELNEYLSHLWKKEITADASILTDELAPVDQYLVEVIKDL